MSAAHFKVKTLHGCLYVNVSLKGTLLRNVLLAFSFNLAYKMPDKTVFMSLVLLCLQPLPGNALKAPPCGRELILISKKPILCLNRPMFLRSKHRDVNVKS